MKNVLSYVASIAFLALFPAACAVDAGDAGSVEGDEEVVAEVEQPLPTTACATTYYDAPDGNIIGYYYINCGGGKYSWGVTSNYHDQVCESCD